MNLLNDQNINSLYHNLRNSNNWIQFHNYQNNFGMINDLNSVDSDSELESLGSDSDSEYNNFSNNQQNYINNTLESVINDIRSNHIRRRINITESNNRNINQILDEIHVLNNTNISQMNNNQNNNLNIVLNDSFEENLNNNETTNKNYLNTIQNLNKIKNKKEVDCTICLEKIEKNTEIFNIKCDHKFHSKCLDSWLKLNNKCPLCRKKI